jgi:predicted glutamine amidotransferase
MCRLYALIANEPTRVECSLVCAQNNLMRQSSGDAEGTVHGHGWGVADYASGVPVVEKQTWAAFHGEHFTRKAARVYADTVIAHVRRATVGPPSLENTHPFVHGRFVFAHNGTLPRFEELRHRLLGHMDDVHRNAIRGQTDSEHMFYYLLSRWSNGPQTDLLETVRTGIEQLVGWCREIDPHAPVGLNIVLSDGEQIVGTRLNRSLWFLERHDIVHCEICGRPHVHHRPRVSYRAVEVASEPLTPDEPWQLVPNATVFAVDPVGRLRAEPMRVNCWKTAV